MKINILTPEIYNRIAAGEVVDRPRSVVKELFENSVDAGATKLTVEISQGGMEMIKVSDNGRGIEREEMDKVFLAHATSKISDISDLSHISTLGFRGEAIASITSVSKVTVLSRTADSELGYYMTYENGIKIDEGEKGCAVGTTVTVENIFKNIPARAKFLKTPKSEGADITALMAKLILTTSNVAIKFIAEGKTIFASDGDGLESAVISVYGREILNNLTYISLSMPDVNISGYVNEPAYSKHNKSFQTIAINGRYIINEEIGYAVFYAFKDYLMTRQYPMFVLDIKIPEDMVDVNVHPGKLEVKFVQPERIRALIKRAIDEKIQESINMPKTISKPTAPTEPDIFEEESINLSAQTTKKVISADKKVSDGYLHKSENNKSGSMQIKESPFSSLIRQIKPIEANRTYYNDLSKENVSSDAQPKLESKKTENKSVPNINILKSIQTAFVDSLDEDIKEDFSAKTQKVGKIFNTYLLLQTGDEMLFVDQHAAHERILYDKLKAEIESSVQIQDLLLPYIFETTFAESALIQKNMEEIKNCGFDLELLSGNAYSLRGIPACLTEMNLKGFVSDLLFNLRGGKLQKTDFIKTAIMQCACKAAVKGDMDLSELDISYILKKLAETKELFCPHGRPIVVRISKTELEKWFKRIV